MLHIFNSYIPQTIKRDKDSLFFSPHQKWESFKKLLIFLLSHYLRRQRYVITYGFHLNFFPTKSLPHIMQIEREAYTEMLKRLVFIKSTS